MGKTFPLGVTKQVIRASPGEIAALLQNEGRDGKDCQARTPGSTSSPARG